MNRIKSITITLALVLFAGNGFAQEAADSTVITEAADTVLLPHFDENAPMMMGATPKLYYIRNVNIRGVKHLNPDILRSTSGLVPGDSLYLPSNYIAQAVGRLWNQRYFSDIKVGATILGDSVDLEVVLQERPLVYRWLFTGVSKGKQRDLTEKLKLKPGTELSDYALDKNEKLIKKYFSDKGFRNTEVTHRITNDTVQTRAVNVTFDIDRKDKVRIGKINFTGNKQFKDRRLRKSLKKIHQKSLNFFRNSKFQEKEYEESKENLIDFYNSRGYRNAHIVRDSVYAINDTRLGIDIDVSEGEKFYIGNVRWLGNSVYETADLERVFGVKSGETYDKKAMYKRLGIGKEANPEEFSVSSMYQNSGYLMSQIDPVEIVTAKDTVDMEIRIFEGKQFSINDVGITGNLRVDDEVIRRELDVRPGELYDRSLLMRSLRMLSTMGHFNPETLQPDIKPVSNELVDINFPLEEQASDQFNIAGGWGSGTFVGSIGVTLNNLSVRNFFKKGAWHPYPMGQNQRLSVSAQTNGTYYKALALSFTDPWLGGHRPNSFTVSMHLSEQNNAYYIWQKASQYFRSTGLSVGLGKRLNWPDPYFTFYGELGYTRYKLKNWNTFVMDNGSANTLALKLVLGRSTVDQPTYPRRGSDFSIAVEATLPYSLWDGIDYSVTDKKILPDSRRYKWIEYHKWLLKGQWFTPLTRNNNLVLMARAEMGYLGHYNKHKVSPFERFEVGGDGMSGYNIYGVDVVSMRGYDDGELDPVGTNYSVAYNKYTVELRYPVILKSSSQIYVLGFAEGGNGFESWQKFSPFKIKRSAGVGVRLYLPVVGMLGIDWGYGFDAPAGQTEKSGSHFHFMMGQTF